MRTNSDRMDALIVEALRARVAGARPAERLKEELVRSARTLGNQVWQRDVDDLGKVRPSAAR